MKITILDPYLESLGGGEKVLAVMAEHLSKNHDVNILVKSKVEKSKVEKYFNVDLSRVTIAELDADPILVKVFTSPLLHLPGRWRSMIYDHSSLKSMKKFNSDLFINNLYKSSLPSTAPKSIYMCMFPQKLDTEKKDLGFIKNTYNKITDSLERSVIGNKRNAVNSYTVVTANSKYTASWIERYWQKESTLLYPVCDYMGPTLKKEKIIMNVGRFFADNGSSHHKKQHELIKAFIKLDQPDWSLYLVGSATNDKDTNKYLKHLETLSEGNKNIFVIPNCQFEKMHELYQKASIYWHATGLGYDPELFPENQEHFGITTVEAMSAGVVPVVINSAGQQEVVEHMKTGMLWNTPKELVAHTNKLIASNDLLSRMSKAATERSTVFNRKSFIKKLDEIIKAL